MAGFGWTSRGIARFTAWLDGGNVPTGLSLRLTRDVPTWATKKLSELEEIPGGNGYAPIQVAPGGVNWAGVDEFDDESASYLERRLRSRSWLAAGGDIPSAGAGFEAVVLVDNSADPNLIGWVDLGRVRTILSGTGLTIPSLALRWSQGELPAALGGGQVLPTLYNQMSVRLDGITATNTWGPWVTIIDPLPFAVAHVILDASIDSRHSRLELAAGAAGSEEPIFLLVVQSSSNLADNVESSISRDPGPLSFPLEVAAGERLSCRVRSGNITVSASNRSSIALLYGGVEV